MRASRHYRPVARPRPSPPPPTPRKRQVPAGLARRRRRRPADRSRASSTAPPEWDRHGRQRRGVRARRGLLARRSSPPARPRRTSRASDAVVLAAARRGLACCPCVQGTPDVGGDCTPGDPGSPPRDPADFARVLTALVARYGPNGSLWAEHPEVAALADPRVADLERAEPHALLERRALGAVLRRSCSRPPTRRSRPPTRGSKTVLAGLPNESWKALEAIYDARGRGAFDVVALHPYTGKPKNVVRIVQDRAARDGRAPGRKLPIWVTELSWPAAVGKTKQEGDFATTDAGQAQRLEPGLKLLAEERRQLPDRARVLVHVALGRGHQSAARSTTPACAACAAGAAGRRPGADRLPAHGAAACRAARSGSGDARRCR